MSDGTVSEKDCSVDTVNNQINLVSGQHFQIKNSSGSFVNAIPQANSIWMLSSTGTDGLEPQKFRVLSVEEKDELVYVITGLSYRDGKYPFIDQGDPLPPRFISLLNRPAPPQVILELLIRMVSRKK
ncbi:MAG: hypothetical protein CM15mV46_300 [Caudoviricetes sp.]|nr:MAG: hypothetical protein CM15mV46_300 [Caudoviricetes sp.]